MDIFLKNFVDKKIIIDDVGKLCFVDWFLEESKWWLGKCSLIDNWNV